MPLAAKSPPIKNKKEIKYQRILGAAAFQMNEKGATSVSLNGVAEAIGITRNALYYYFKDKQSLLYACYLDAAMTTAKNLSEIQDLPLTTAEKLRDFMERTLTAGGYEKAILSNLDILLPPQKDKVEALINHNTHQLEQIIAQGIANGELRKVDCQIATQVLLGILSWARLCHQWQNLDGEFATNRWKATTELLSDIFLYGLSTDPDYKPVKPISVQEALKREVDVFDSVAISEEKRLRIIELASRVFNQRGIDSTSMDDIVEQIKATKGTIYHYFKDKQSLVNACFNHAYEQYEFFLNAGLKEDTSFIDQQYTILHLNCQAQASKSPPLTPQGGVSNLASVFAARSKKIAFKMHKIQLEAIASGQYRSVNKLSVELGAGGFFWIPSWIKDQPAVDPSTLADEICNISFFGVMIQKTLAD